MSRPTIDGGKNTEGCTSNLKVHGGKAISNHYRKLRDELSSREEFDTLLEAKVVVERWRQEYNHIRPHSSLG